MNTYQDSKEIIKIQIDVNEDVPMLDSRKIQLKAPTFDGK